MSVVSRKNSILWGKMQRLIYNSVAQVLFLKTTIILLCTAEVLYTYFPFHYTDYFFKCTLQGQNLIKLIIFTVSSKTFLSETMQLLIQFCATTLIHNKMPEVLSTMLLQHQCRYQHSEKGKRCPSIIIKVIFCCSTSDNSSKCVSFGTHSPYLFSLAYEYLHGRNW